MAGVSEGPQAFFRLSPVARSEASSFGVKRGEITGRFDVNYWRLTPLFHERFKKPVYPPTPLGSVVALVQYGCSSLATERPIGTPMLRMNNLQDDGWDLRDVKFIVLTPEEVDRYRVEPGDLLFNRTNSKELVGKCAVFSEPGDWVFASYLIRVRLRRDEVLPQFASDFLNSSTGRLQIDRLSRQIIGMTNINADELKQILLPLPPEPKQQELLAAMDVARVARLAKLADADAMLAGLDDFLLEAIGLTEPKKDDRNVFAVQQIDVEQQERLNADYFHPERALALRGMRLAAKHLNCSRLEHLVFFIREQLKKPGPNYVGLAHVQSHTGELVDTNEESTGACSAFKSGDVLFARLRPYLNKVYRAEADGCCSPEFHVLRVRNEGALLPDYVAAILRSTLILAQTRHMMTGNTHPRLTNDDVINLVIPVPEPVVQERIAAEARRRREDARRFRAKAETEWLAAKQWFEAQLLGEKP